ncbi:MAG TPA: four helix bundle protein [Phycisphaerae bacterium]|nr:four helix bundle protein [Phycisphaerae bacterium]
MEPTDAREQLRPRTKQFALRTIRVIDALPKTSPAQVIGKQLLRSALSVGANYRAACRARSRAEFVAKMGIVEEESDEARYWMEILTEAGLLKQEQLAPLMKEAGEIAAMVVASIKTARKQSK